MKPLQPARKRLVVVALESVTQLLRGPARHARGLARRHLPAPARLIVPARLGLRLCPDGIAFQLRRRGARPDSLGRGGDDHARHHLADGARGGVLRVLNALEELRGGAVVGKDLAPDVVGVPLQVIQPSRRGGRQLHLVLRRLQGGAAPVEGVQHGVHDGVGVGGADKRRGCRVAGRHKRLEYLRGVPCCGEHRGGPRGPGGCLSGHDPAYQHHRGAAAEARGLHQDGAPRSGGVLHCLLRWPARDRPLECPAALLCEVLDLSRCVRLRLGISTQEEEGERRAVQRLLPQHAGQLGSRLAGRQHVGCDVLEAVQVGVVLLAHRAADLAVGIFAAGHALPQHPAPGALDDEHKLARRTLRQRRRPARARLGGLYLTDIGQRQRLRQVERRPRHPPVAVLHPLVEVGGGGDDVVHQPGALVLDEVDLQFVHILEPRAAALGGQPQQRELRAHDQQRVAQPRDRDVLMLCQCAEIRQPVAVVEEDDVEGRVAGADPVGQPGVRLKALRQIGGQVVVLRVVDDLQLDALLQQRLLPHLAQLHVALLAHVKDERHLVLLRRQLARHRQPGDHHVQIIMEGGAQDLRAGDRDPHLVRRLLPAHQLCVGWPPWHLVLQLKHAVWAGKPPVAVADAAGAGALPVALVGAADGECDRQGRQQRRQRQQHQQRPAARHAAGLRRSCCCTPSPEESQGTRSTVRYE
mmetsp:Transcript_21904/g.55212  ORF Transcript_21904/g.55212 Transcript_21904/m.55212 type:complete len:695 (+) Transcript_21904:920-3004(+)